MSKQINVLCLHGCNQTQEMFQRLLKNYIRLGEKQYDLKFHFIEAKYDHPNGGKTWYNKPLDVEKIGSIKYDEKLVSDALDDIEKFMSEKKETGIIFDSLLGFSQGGNVVDTFLSKRKSSIMCAVIMSGYSLVDSDRVIINIPMLSVVSDQDTIVPSKFNPVGYSKEYFLYHDKGHKLPTRNPQIRKICTFMQKSGADYE